MKTTPLPEIPPPKGTLPAESVLTGQNIPPIERLRIMSPTQWEDFVLEWAHSLELKYEAVERCAGAGDQGRDIVAYEIKADLSVWDNYQCKHYPQPLTPSDIWGELGKLCYYTFIKEYSPPREYYFVAPHGAGNKLSRLLRNADLLRSGLIKEWDAHCRTKITSTKEILLDAKIRAHIEAFNFSNIRALSPLTIIDQHRLTPWHATRFGGGLPTRPAPPTPPVAVESHEANYVRALLDAYEDRLKRQLPAPDSLKDEALRSHFSRSRREFYCAEALKEFSRDNVPPGTFDQLLDEVHDGVVDVVEGKHSDAVERVLETVKQAKGLQLSANSLVCRVLTTDRGGMCHQLANARRLWWRR
ncbi:MAG: hypothetical protein HOP32_16170 [Nitrospira sp.]|nr:hypothetical protein [Nitrospira sp.]